MVGERVPTRMLIDLARWPAVGESGSESHQCGVCIQRARINALGQNWSDYGNWKMVDRIAVVSFDTEKAGYDLPSSVVQRFFDAILFELPLCVEVAFDLWAEPDDEITTYGDPEAVRQVPAKPKPKPPKRKTNRRQPFRVTRDYQLLRLFTTT